MFLHAQQISRPRIASVRHRWGEIKDAQPHCIMSYLRFQTSIRCRATGHSKGVFIAAGKLQGDMPLQLASAAPVSRRDFELVR